MSDAAIAPNQPSVSPSLDRLAYPHIADAIFKYADNQALLHLRITCKEWRDRADNTLVHHLDLVGLGKLCALGPGDPVRHPASYPPSNLKREGDFDPLDRRGKERRIYEWSHFANTNLAVDWTDRPDPPRENYFPAGLQPRYLRLWEHSRRAFTNSDTVPCPTDTVVVFAWWKGPPVPTPHPPLRYPSGCTPFKNLHPSTRKLVVNLSSASWDIEDGYLETTFASDFLKHCAVEEIVFNIIPGDTCEHSFDTLCLRLYCMLVCVALDDEEYSLSVRRTLVNTDAIDHEAGCYIDLEEAGDGEAERRFQCPGPFEERARAFLDILPGDHQSKFEFLTTAQYKGRVGAERYRSETVEKLWSL